MAEGDGDEGKKGEDARVPPHDPTMVASDRSPLTPPRDSGAPAQGSTTPPRGPLTPPRGPLTPPRSPLAPARGPLTPPRSGVNVQRTAVTPPRPMPAAPRSPPRLPDILNKEPDSVTVTVMGIEKALRQGLSSQGPHGTVVFQQGGTFDRLSNAAIPKKGDRLGGDNGRRFEIIERLGEGGMAVVLLAKDTLLDRTVAIKFVTHEIFGVGGADVVERFKLEARASARVSHENIVRIFDLGTANGVPFLVMEHLEGRPLDSIEAHQELDTLRAVRVLEDVARGLSHAHKSGIVHRDLKPSNVFIVKDGRAKIVDFGLASVAFGSDSRGAEWSALAGTPRYMSPEQWRGETQDGRTDIWAAGVMLFEMLVGHPPFRGEGIFEVRGQVLSSDPPPTLRQFRPDLPEEAEHIIQRALTKDPAKRMASADELLDALVALEVALTRTRTGPLRTTDLKTPSFVKPKSERRQMTFLSCSLVDLMALSEQLELDDFSELLGGFFEVCSTVVRQLEGIILSNLGGRVFASFGYPVAHEDDAQRAVRAGFLIAGAIGNLTRKDGTPHAAQIGIHTGMAITAKLPDALPNATPIIQGEAPHIATWLERRAGANEILMSQRTHTLVRGLFEMEPLGSATPDGASRALELFRARRPEASAMRFERGGNQSLTPLVGRDNEVQNLRAWWARAKAGEGQFIMVSGEAGIGKSRMVELLQEHVAAEPHHRIGCQSWLHFQNTALYPIASGIMAAANVRADSPASDKLRKLEAWLTELDLPLDEHVPLLASILSIPLSSAYTAPALSPDILKTKVLESIVTTMLRLAEQEPTLLILEDVHWSDSSTKELLSLLVGRIQSARLLLLVTFRPGFTPPWPERPHLHRIALQRLTSSQTQAMAVFAAEGRKLPAEVMDQLVRRADGIPLFVEELTRMVADAWQEAEQKGEAQSALAFASDTIPATLSELLLERLDRLADHGKEVAQFGAVLGREFSYQLIQLASPLDEHALRFGLMQLVEAGMLRQEGQGDETHYVFKHALLQDAAYQSLVRSRRQEHHLRAAQTLVKYFPEVTDPHPELIGHHFAEAARPEEAIEYLERAGNLAVQRSANSDAVIHFSNALFELRARPASPERDRRELALQLALGAPLMATKGHAAPQVRETYARARELCEVAGDDAQLFPTVLGLTQFYIVAGEPKVSAQLGQQLLAQGERAGDPTLLMLAHRAVGGIFNLVGDAVRCRSHSEKGLALYSREKHGKLAMKYGIDPGVASGGYLSWCLWFLGFPDQAVEQGRASVRLAEEVEHPTSVAFALYYLAAVHSFRGEHDLSRDVARRGLTLATEQNLAMWVAMFKNQLGWALFGAGERAAGAEQLKEGLAAWTKTGAKAGLTFFLAALIWTQWQSGQLDEAMKTIEETEALVKAQDERYVEVELLRLRGEVMLAADPSSSPAAIEIFKRGAALARSRHTRGWELRISVSLARELAKQGQIDEARSTLAPVVEWFREGLDVADLREARSLLASCRS